MEIHVPTVFEGRDFNHIIGPLIDELSKTLRVFPKSEFDCFRLKIKFGLVPGIGNGVDGEIKKG